MKSDATARYDAVAKSLHWFIALILIPMLFFGGDLIRVRDGTTTLPSLHVTIGVGILVLSVSRLVWRLMNPPPPLPATMAGWERAGSRAGHYAFYALMLGLPITGWLALPGLIARHAEMAGLKIFGVFGVPGAPELGLPAGGIHDLLGKLGIALLILHVAAGLKHHFVDRDNVLRRMLPW